MTSHRLPIKLGVLAVGIVSACSLTVPSEDELFGEPPAGGSSGNSAAGSAGNTSSGGDPSDSGGGGSNGGTTTAGGGNSPTGGADASSGAGGEGGAGGPAQGGAGGEPPEPPMPTGEIVNPSFEDSMVGWTIDPPSQGLFVQYAEGTGAPVLAVDGKWVLSGWSKQNPQKPYASRVFQIIKGIEDGTYKLTAQVMSIAGINKAELYARNCGGTDPEPVPSLSSSWTELVIDGIEVTGGECEVGVDIDANSSDWVNVDKFTWEKIAPE